MNPQELLALAIKWYASYLFGFGVGVLGVLGFLAGHGYYFYIEVFC